MVKIYHPSLQSHDIRLTAKKSRFYLAFTGDGYDESGTLFGQALHLDSAVVVLYNLVGDG